MLYFDRIDASERIYVNKTSASRECDICHYWYFLNFFSSLNIKDYCCIISLISKTEAISIIQNASLTKKVEHYKT